MPEIVVLEYPKRAKCLKAVSRICSFNLNFIDVCSKIIYQRLIKIAGSQNSAFYHLIHNFCAFLNKTTTLKSRQPSIYRTLQKLNKRNYKLTCPIVFIQGSVIDRLSQMMRTNSFRLFQIGNCPCHFKYAIIRPS